jgi:hypothetical protein
MSRYFLVLFGTSTTPLRDGTGEGSEATGSQARNTDHRRVRRSEHVPARGGGQHRGGAAAEQHHTQRPPTACTRAENEKEGVATYGEVEKRSRAQRRHQGGDRLPTIGGAMTISDREGAATIRERGCDRRRPSPPAAEVTRHPPARGGRRVE